jgi:hypothetical protein
MAKEQAQMRKFAVVWLLALFACSGGGSDPLAGVENCSDLAEAVEAGLDEFEPGSVEAEAFIEDVRVMGQEMAEEAIARGAEVEAVLCAEAVVQVGAAAVEEVFSEIGSGLD